MYISINGLLESEGVHLNENCKSCITKPTVFTTVLFLLHFKFKFVIVRLTLASSIQATFNYFLLHLNLLFRNL